MRRQRKKDLFKVHLFNLKEALQWCIAKFGFLEFVDIPNIRVHNNLKLEVLVEENDEITLSHEFSYGCYDMDKNCIYVNVSFHDDVMDLSKTVIHEYIHYLQNLEVTNSTWTKDYTVKPICDSSEAEIDDLIENEAEYYACENYLELMKHLGYDNPHS